MYYATADASSRVLGERNPRMLPCTSLKHVSGAACCSFAARLGKNYNRILVTMITQELKQCGYRENSAGTLSTASR